MNIQITQLSSLEIPLANKFYKANKARGTAKRNEQVWVARVPDIVAACCIQRVDDHLLLTGVMVVEALRSRGLGKQLITAAVSEQEQTVYTFPYAQLTHWYDSLGFKLVNTEGLPESIREKFETYKAQGRDIVVMSRG